MPKRRADRTRVVDAAQRFTLPRSEGPSDVKWVFLLGLLVFTPWLAMHLKANPKHLPYAGFAVGILPYLMSGLNLTASPISWAHWPGPVKGLDISLLDGIAVALIYVTKGVRTPLLLKCAFALYMLGIIVSTITADEAGRVPSIFYFWQVCRGALVYFAVARACATAASFPVSIIMGLGAGVGFQSLIALKQYLSGYAQAGAWFGHQNLLGMASHFAVFPALALVLAGYYSRWALPVVVAGLVVAFTGASRATIGLFAIGLGVTLCLSLWRKGTGRKAAVAGALVLALLASAPFLYSAVGRRSDKTLEDSNIERSIMISAAKLIISDHPLGVGANRYVIVANVGGYSDRVGLAWNKANRTAPVHNTYYLVTAELGWIGLFGLIALFASIIGLGLRAIRSAPSGVGGEILVGTTACAIVFAAHAYFEWVAMLDVIHYLAGINVGMLIGVAQLAGIQKRRSHSVRLSRARLATTST